MLFLLQLLFSSTSKNINLNFPLDEILFFFFSPSYAIICWFLSKYSRITVKICNTVQNKNMPLVSDSYGSRNDYWQNPKLRNGKIIQLYENARSKSLHSRSETFYYKQCLNFGVPVQNISAHLVFFFFPYNKHHENVRAQRHLKSSGTYRYLLLFSFFSF